jgi:fructokinase
MDRDVLVVGESLVDIVRGADGSTVEYAGGSAANVAVALARLGRPVRFATSFADDPRGRMLAEHLKGAGVELATDPGAVARTSTAVATIGADGAAHYDFDLEWRLHPVEPGDPPLVVHTCSLGAVLTPGADDVYALLNGLRGQATISYDVNARPAITGTGPDIVARVERMVAISDLVKASDEDLTALYPDVDHLVAARNLLALGPAAVVVTRGADGAMWVGASGEVESPRCPCRSLTRSGPATRSGRRSSTRSGSANGSAGTGARRCATSPLTRWRRCWPMRPAPPPSPCRAPAPIRRTATS